MNYSKDGVTVAAMFDSAHPKKSGKCSVKIRVTYNRVRHYYPTGKDLMPAEGRPANNKSPCTCGDTQGHRKQLPDSADGC